MARRTLPSLRCGAGRVLGIAALAVPLVVGAGVATATTPAHPAFTQHNLVSDLAGRAQLTDPNLVNPWGLALSPTGPLWVANNGTSTATIYAGGAGGAPVTKAPLTVTVPGDAPTGEVFNDTSDFVVHGPGGSGPALFAFVSETGNLSAWNPTASPTRAIVEKHVPGAIFKGLALVHTPFGPFLLATDFHNGRIVAFDRKFHRVPLPAAFFRDRTLPAGYAPFGIAALGNAVYVSYAKQDADAEDEVDGAGRGFVDRYVGLGLVHQRVASRGVLDAPWGLTVAPASFGSLAGDLLVGNFGDGRISAFDRHTGAFEGQLRNRHGVRLQISGLWGLLPGTAATGGTDALWFSAGIADEAHGLVGLIRPTH